MIEVFAVRLSKWYVRHKWIEAEDADVFRYGAEVILSSLINVVAFLVLAFCFSSVLEGLLFLVVFIGIRQFSGGYHSNTYAGCISTFMLVSIAMFALLRFTPVDWVHPLSVLLAGLGLLPILLFSPAPNPVKTPTEAQKKRARAISQILGCFAMLAVVLIAWSGVSDRFEYAISLALLAIGVSMILPMFSSKGGEQSEEER